MRLATKKTPQPQKGNSGAKGEKTDENIKGKNTFVLEIATLFKGNRWTQKLIITMRLNKKI